MAIQYNKTEDAIVANLCSRFNNPDTNTEELVPVLLKTLTSLVLHDGKTLDLYLKSLQEQVETIQGKPGLEYAVYSTKAEYDAAYAAGEIKEGVLGIVTSE